MRTIRFRTCQVIGIGTGIAIANGCPSSIATYPATIEEIPRPHRLHLKIAPSATLHQRAISQDPYLALSTPTVTDFLTTTSKTDLKSHLRADTTPYSTPTNRKPRSSPRHPWAWLPSLFFLGFGLGIIRRVKMSLTSRHNDSHSSKDSESYHSSSSDYGDSDDFSRGDRGK